MVYRVEIGKAFRTRGIRFALLAGGLISVLQSIWVYLNLYRQNNAVCPNHMMQNAEGGNLVDWWFEGGILQAFIGTETYSMYNEMFFLVMPILAVLPYALSFHIEWKNGYVNQMVTRCGRIKYLTAKFLAVFISGSSVILLPLVFNLLVSACIFPAIGIDPLSLQSGVSNADMWGVIFYEKPVWYAIGYIGIDLIYGGIFSCMTLVCSMWVTNRFSAAIFPLLVNCTCYYGVDNIFYETRPYNPAIFINPCQIYNTNRFDCIIEMTAGLIALLIALFLIVNRKKDIL